MLIFCLFTSLLTAFAGAWFMSRYAYHFSLLDIPNQRSSHSLPTPRGGGVGILASFIVLALWLSLPLSFWLPAVILALVSLFDDRLNLSPKMRILFQFAAATAVVVPLLALHKSTTAAHLLLILSACVYIVGTANFFNFMDGINGIAGITGAVAFLLLTVFAYVHHANTDLAILTAAVAASCIGFLPFNIPKARVFMGDVGSILLGFVFAAMCLVLTKSATDFLVLCGFLSTFYADALTTLYVRKRDGEQLSQAHRRHLYQLLANQMKIPHWKISYCYGLIQLVIGLILITLKPLGILFVVVFQLFLIACWCIVSLKIRTLVSDVPSIKT